MNKNFDKIITKPNFFKLAFGGGTPLKAFITACVVGAILTAINHGDKILEGEYPNFFKVFLTFCVPYCVTTWGAITGKMNQFFTNVQNLLHKGKIIELSFFNFENAITAAYFADQDFRLNKVNKNFKKFFPMINNLEKENFISILYKLNISERNIEFFKSQLDKNGKVFIPELKIVINGEEKYFSLLSTKTENKNFGFLNGYQGQFVDLKKS